MATGPSLQGHGVDMGIHQHAGYCAASRAARGRRLRSNPMPATACAQTRRSAPASDSPPTARPGWFRSPVPSGACFARDAAVDARPAAGTARTLSGTQARPSPAETRLTMVCIWIASCATARRAPGCVVHAEDRVVQRGHDAARKDHQRLGRARGPRRACVPQPARCCSGSASTSGSRTISRWCRPGGAKPGRMQHEAGVDVAARQASQLHVAGGLDQLELDLRVRRAERPHPVRQQLEARWSRRRPGAVARLSPAAAARACAGRACARASRSRASGSSARRPAVSATLRLRAIEQAHAQRASRAAAMACVSGGCVMCRRAAARPKCSSSATATNWRQSAQVDQRAVIHMRSILIRHRKWIGKNQ